VKSVNSEREGWKVGGRVDIYTTPYTASHNRKGNLALFIFLFSF
jgi:hypothetical protein